MVIVVLLYKYTKNSLSLHFKWMNCTYVNHISIKVGMTKKEEKVQILPKVDHDCRSQGNRRARGFGLF